MERAISLIFALTLCVLSGDLDGNGIVNFKDFTIFADNWLKRVDDQNDVEEVMIELVELDVNDTNLELNYKIKNNSDHDVWICDRVDDYSDSRFSFEAYLAEDAKTLVIRKRLDVPILLRWNMIPVGRYLRLRPGQEKTESLSLTLPVRPRLVYTFEQANAERASRLVLEIGFYNEDLIGLIRSIIEVAERLDCVADLDDYYSDIVRRYFKGSLIPVRFGSLSHFDEKYNDMSEELLTSSTEELLGEEVLQIVVEDLSIPYDG